MKKLWKFIMNITRNICWLATTFLLGSCRANQCGENAATWIKEAPVALEEFLGVKQEILANQALLDSFTRNGLLYLGGPNGPEKFAGFDVPKLKKWFEKGHDTISFGQGDSTATYRTCEEGRTSAWAILHFGPIDRTKYNNQVRVIDTMKLQNGWSAEVTRCHGCGS